ncbi:MAG: DUF1810 domain-containing protein [Bacteroidota bacterium]|jgi:uncharacterized protein (DUF1810 family)
MKTGLDRYIEAQEHDYAIALREVKAGRKKNHWMWYIFPQIQGLGHSQTSQYFAIRDLAEARAYLEHPLLGIRLREISQALLQVKPPNATHIFGSPDDLKLRSCMTLFAIADPDAHSVFRQVLDKFFGGRRDPKTENLLKVL